MNLFEHLLDPANWSGPGGISARLLEHISYSGAALAIAALIALPIGILIGHTGRGNVLVAGMSNAARALPTLGLLTLVVVLLGTGAVPVVLALVVLAIPPILNGTVVGFRTADADAVLAARAMGMTHRQQIGRVELPLAMPLVLSGIRSAALQVIATATVAALAAAGGLGRFVIDGQRRRDGYPEMFTGAMLVMVLAILVDLVLGGITRLAQRRSGGRRRIRADLFDAVEPGKKTEDTEGASA
jgi:osmoprotectant transport system permease protein